MGTRNAGVKLCIHYRLMSIICSTAAYFIWLPWERPGLYGLGVSVGMITACAVGTFLYKKTFFEEEHRTWLLVTLMLEMGEETVTG